MPAILQAFCFAKLFLLHAKLQQCNTAQRAKDTSRTYSRLFATLFVTKGKHTTKNCLLFLQAFCFAKLFLLHAKLQQCNTAQRAKDTSRTYSRLFAVFTAKLTVKNAGKFFDFSVLFPFLSFIFHAFSVAIPPLFRLIRKRSQLLA